MKKILKVVMYIFLFFFLVVAAGGFYVTRGLKAGSKLEINRVNLSVLSDGIYNGKYSDGRWSNEVNIAVKDHKITKIDLVKDVLFPKHEWTLVLFQSVVEKQNTNIDVISGATVTSKAYLKSIENALNK